MSTYVLKSDGRLYLVSYTYTFSKQPEEVFEEQLEGDFWLVMKPHFEAARIYIPFIRSGIVTAVEQWVHEPPRQSLKEIPENKP
ncbi:MAG: TetR-like C-terminal domain-containing protein [Leptolyngbyaceae bacterium]|nr:TetR-like C-terminal domain-containing protein [Leptolyngbyaceae bacterium]